MSAPNTIIGLGALTDHIATVPQLDAARLQLTAEEGSVLQLVGRVERIDQVLARSKLGEPRTIAVLLALRAKGAIVPARVVPRGAPAPVVDAAMAEEVDLEPERKKEIIELERSLDAMDHFAVLGLKPGAPASEVKQAYYNASRRFHPDRYFGKNLGSFRARMERIFRRLTDAHNVLMQPDKREAYLRANPALAQAERAAAPPPPSAPPPSAPAQHLLTPEPPPVHQLSSPPPAPRPPVASSGPSSIPPPSRPLAPPPDDGASEARRAERQARLARHPYLARTGRLAELIARGKAAIASGDWERAYHDFHQVQTMDPKNREVALLLVKARRGHDSQRATIEVARGREMERHGDTHGAMSAYRLACSLDDRNAEAAWRCARLGNLLGQDAAESRGLAQRAVELEPDKVEHQLTLGKVLLDSGSKKLAKRAFEDAAKLAPDNAEAKAALKKLRWTF
ncbi:MULTISPECIES: J domain-containing protein [Myxococcus]|uniref:J domain-containing protein n=1 Tax=Myxococcus TaxID=32 RepID=UPI0003162E4A|nr:MULTISPECIES: J domain-containing protein [Myxococcus]NOJ55588.1 DnaJ domain-containing protein [Myxococcus xanthus]QPM82485.1 DnaJ domain-containing protein [Myxococcus xanthus]QVW64790.1 DnaJ domain-containing protein [Myxococcus xanthus DZ2]QZZ50731.1 Chaperone protein DnaJ [Myxococcus xanthus]UEO02139.1 DnaJ domain-containing protein [Myxococcus xanthus DZ2]